MKPGYYVETWDAEKDEFSPQKGVRKGPYTLFGLRQAIRALQGMGYPVFGDPSVRIYHHPFVAPWQRQTTLFQE